MGQQELVTAFEGLVWFGLAMAVIYLPWQKVCVDYARDVIFQQRDIVFDLAAAGDLTFGTEPYETVRSSMNAMIRLAHCFTFPRLAVVVWTARDVKTGTARSDIRAAISRIENENTRRQVEAAWRASESALLTMMVLRSPLIIVLLLLTAVFGRLSAVRAKMEAILAKPLEAAIGNEVRHAA